MLFSNLALALLAIVPFVSAGLVEKRAFDICAFVYTDLVIDGINFGLVELCVCIDLVDTVIDSQTSGSTDTPIKKAVAKTSHNTVKKWLTSEIEAINPDGCTYPPNSTPVCTQTNPCAFTCNAPYVPSSDGTTCVLASAPSGTRKKRDLNTCSYGMSRCGVWSSWGPSSRSYECVDTQSELESCGGCTVPYGNEVATGHDCTQIKGVADVECLSGACSVNKCRAGFAVSNDGTSCVPLLHPAPHTAPQHAGPANTTPNYHFVEDVFGVTH